MRVERGRGASRIYQLSNDEMSPLFIPGKQLGIDLGVGFTSEESEKEYRDMMDDPDDDLSARTMTLYFRFSDSWGSAMYELFDALENGGSVDSVTVIGMPYTLKLTDTPRPEKYIPRMPF